MVAHKAARDGAKVIVRAPDWYSDFPYQWVSWSHWLSAVDAQAKAIKAADDMEAGTGTGYYEGRTVAVEGGREQVRPG